MFRRLFTIHSWLGLVAGLGLLIIGITGSIIVFKEELDGLIIPHLVKVPNPELPRLAPDAFIAAFRQQQPGYEITGWGSSRIPGHADSVYAVKLGETDSKLLYVDPATGKAQGDAMEWDSTLTSWLLSLHYSFRADHVGEAIAGVFAVMLCLLGITGVWLYRGFWKTLFLLRWGRTARIFFSDLHKMIGISSTVFNLILGFTGAWWNLSHLIGHLLEEEHEETKPVAVTGPGWAQTISVDALLEQTRAKIPGFTPNWTSLPSSADPEPEIAFYGSTDTQGILRSQYGYGSTFDPISGELKKVENIREMDVWDQVQDAFRPLHYGDFGGVPIKILWCFGGLTPAILALTGSLMWWKRRKPSRKKKLSLVRSAAGAASPSVP